MPIVGFVSTAENCSPMRLWHGGLNGLLWFHVHFFKSFVASKSGGL